MSPNMKTTEKSNKGFATIKANVPQELHDHFKQVCKEKDKPMRKAIIKMVTNFIAENGK